VNVEKRTYDVIVIGAGQGGTPLAATFAEARRHTALIERANVGGTCVNTGCTPSKTMIASAAVANCVSRASEYGVEVEPPFVRLQAIRDRKESLVRSFRAQERTYLESIEGLDVCAGEASFVGTKTLEVRSPRDRVMELSSETIIIDTGSRPSVPPISGIREVPTFDSTSIMELTTLPEHLAILGGGTVGVEFAQMFRRFGCAVTLIEQSSQLLPQEDPDIATALSSILSEEGITLRVGCAVKFIEQHGKRIRILGAKGNGNLCVLCSHVLIAAGRTPNTDALGLSNTGVKILPSGHIEVDDRLQTSVPGIFAMGDVTGGAPFTHISYDDYRILRTNLVLAGQASTAHRIVSYVIYVDPQLGRVGLSETQAAAAGVPYRLAKMPMRCVARARETGHPRGFLKALVDPASGRVLGASVLGDQGGEIMSILHVAMLAGLSYDVLRDAPFAHPTYAEGLNSLFSSLSSTRRGTVPRRPHGETAHSATGERDQAKPRLALAKSCLESVVRESEPVLHAS
jgi:pyruvate/2-oxoglutarate dehydrogenase complex dihydrolipoamide dehydrogenase (E3) component